MEVSALFRKIIRLCCLCAGLLLGSCASQQDQVLFNSGGQGWLSSGESEWRFVGGELVGHADESAGFVMTEEQFADFVLELEFFPDEKINSGVFTRCSEIALSAENCYEFNIWDEHPDQASRTGAVVSRASPVNKVSTINQWNTYKIHCEKGKIRAWINGTLVVDLKNEDLISGYIGLQASGKGTIRFRDVRIKPLTD